jgi:hypothetical protein
MQAKEMDAARCTKASDEPTASMAVGTNWGEYCAADTPVEDQQLIDTAVVRNLFPDTISHRNLAANALASGRRAVRLLWMALIVSLAAHLIIPVCIVTAMIRPEKVALMDGTESLIISPLIPVEESNEILETVSLWAAKSFLDRGPQGFDAPETLQRLFLPEAAKKAEAEFKTVAEEFSKKSIHQKLEIGRIDLQRLEAGVVMSRVIGQILTRLRLAMNK